MIKLNLVELQNWRNNDGENKHILNYDLDENSIVMDLGGYTGEWCKRVENKFNCKIYIIEPLLYYYNILTERFNNNPKIKTLNYGIGNKTKDGIIFLNQDGSSSNSNDGISQLVKIITFDEILNLFNLTHIDLLQMNIEGDEYIVLENMLETGSINKVTNIQIQFHLGIDDCIEKRNSIRQGLIDNGFKIKYEYPFVWESWTKSK